MKYHFKTRICSTLLAILLLASMIPVAIASAASDNKTKEITQTMLSGKIAPINQDYIDYINSGEKGENGYVPSTLDLSYLSNSYALQQKKYLSKTSIPESYNLADYGLSPTVSNQGAYGTCWAFQAMASVESVLMKQFPNISLSTKHLSWFTHAGQEESKRLDYYANSTDGGISPYMMGGNATEAVATLAAWKGPIFTSDMPYEPAETVDENMRYEADFHIQDAIFLRSGALSSAVKNSAADVATVKQLMIENQAAIGVDYCASEADGDSSYYNVENDAVYHKDYESANHAVTIIGWDDNFSKNKFNEGCQPENDGAWLVKNSWGIDQGINGNFWISYEDATIAYDCVYKVEETDNYENNYQYDVNGWCTSYSADVFYKESQASKTAYISNIFTSKGKEQIEAVSFYTTDVNTSYEISVYTGVADNQPTSGKLAYSGQSGREYYAGYHTIELDSPVRIEEGEQYSVVVKLENPTYAYPIAGELSMVSHKTSDLESLGEKGQSFYSSDGDSWNDSFGSRVNYSNLYLYTSNICLKAFTNPVSEDEAEVSKVRFSIPEGPIAVGDKLELIGNGDIYYQITDSSLKVGEVYEYSEPITLDGACTVTAWAQDGNKKGVANSNVYTKGQSLITQIIAEQNGKTSLFDLKDGDNDLSFRDSGFEKPVKLLIQGGDNISVNGKEVKSNVWTDDIEIKSGEKNVITIVSSQEGKEATTYTLTVEGNVLNFDYDKETVSFDDNKFSVTAADGTIIENGASISEYIVDRKKSYVYLTAENLDNGEKHKQRLLRRYSFSTLAIDYKKENTYNAFGSVFSYSYNSDMSDAKVGNNAAIPLEPGNDIYIQRIGDASYVKSDIFKLEVPERPETPEAVVESVSPDTITMQSVEGAEYQIDGEDWEDDNTLQDLDFNTAYDVNVRIKATNSNFASETSSVSTSTCDGTYVNVVYKNITNGKEFWSDKIAFAVGKHTVYPDQKLLDLEAFKLSPDAPESLEVNVTEQDEEFIAENDTVVFDIIPSIDTTDYFYSVLYFDLDGKVVDFKSDIPYENINHVRLKDIPMPDGYRAYEKNGEKQLTRLLCYDKGIWVECLNNVRVLVEKLPSAEPTTEPTTESTTEPIVPSSESSTSTASTTSTTKAATKPTASSKKPTLKITLKKPNIKLTAGKKKLTVKFKKVKNAKKYKIQYRVKGKKKWKTKTTTKLKTVIKKLKKGKKYQVRVRAVASQNGKAVYGSYSKIKTIKVK